MKNFDIDVNFNGVENDLFYLNLDGDEDDKTNIEEENKTEKKPKKKKPKNLNWTKELDKYTDLFKEFTYYETPAQREARLEKEKQEQGTKTKILGLNPLVAVGFSFILIVGGIVAVVKLKSK